MQNDYSHTFYATAGIAIRKQLKHFMRQLATSHNVQLVIDEDKGFLRSYLTFSVSGNLLNVEAFLSDTKKINPKADERKAS